MINAIRQFFDSRLNADDAAKTDEQRLRLATAALLVEMMRMDDAIEPEERDAVMDALRTKFGLTGADAAELVRLAEDEAQAATDYFQFTSLINRHYSPEDKAQVIEHLWEVAYADGTLDRHEEHFMRKIADLLYVPYKSYIGAKLRARDRILGPDSPA